MTNNMHRISRSTDPMITDRARTYLNFALHLAINHDDARNIATFAIDDASNQLDPTDAPFPTDSRMILLALANESFSSDDDFDDFLHELDHCLDQCTDPFYCS